MPPPNEPTYNRDMAELMTKNIPKFELNSSTNSALELRSFLKACENILSLYPDEELYKKEFFALIKFRLGYDVQKRITKSEFTSLKDLKNHLRSICHIKLNRGKLLEQIRNDRQSKMEDVSDFVERLRKFIAQGRSEYPDDKEFEKEAIRTLKNGVRNELISIKLLDSDLRGFENLADIAITRDSDLNQRICNSMKPEMDDTKSLITELLEKIKMLETTQAASVQHIRESRYRSRSPNPFRSPSKSPQTLELVCRYCKKSGHTINECFKRTFRGQYENKSPTRGEYPEQSSRTNYNFHNQIPPNVFPNYMYFQDREYQSRNPYYFPPNPYQFNPNCNNLIL